MEFQESNIANIIHAKSRRRLYFGYILLILSGLIFLWQLKYISNLFSGPRPIVGEALESELLSGNIKSVNINLRLPRDSVFQTGYTNVTKKIDKYTNKVESQTTDSEYYITLIGKHILVLESTPDKLPSGHFSGVIIPLQSDLRRKLIDDFNSTQGLAGWGDYIFPFTLSNKSMLEFSGFWVFLIGIGLLCWGAILVYRRTTDIEDNKHYAYRIAKTAGYYSIDSLSADYIISRQAGMVEIGKYHLCNQFLFANRFFSFKIYPLSQMIWAYKKVTKKSINFIPMGVDHTLVMHFRPNVMVEIKEPEENVNKHLILLTSLCPEAKFGYN
jgi:hypothetical protein